MVNHDEPPGNSRGFKCILDRSLRGEAKGSLRKVSVYLHDSARVGTRLADITHPSYVIYRALSEAPLK